MKVCPNCQSKYPDDANFCPREGCASAEGPSRLMPIADEPPARFAPANVIGGSRSGEVWQAQDGQTGETVAYKLVSLASLPTPTAVERAQRELKQLMRSQSARIARVLDCGKAADGRIFIATELCGGEPLNHVIERSGSLSLERTKKIIAQIGEALLEGQKVGVVHHDLSPKNILIEGDDDVKVINFTVPVPVTDRVFGVPEFLSPEQADGKPADQRSNTYGLGALAVFMLTGAPPFSGASPQAVLEQVQRGDVQPPSQRRAELTPEIDRVILRAMDKNSSRRPLTLRQFLNEVASMHLAGAPAPAPRPAAGLNRTIAYAGGAPDVRRLVAEATAARAEANGSGPVVGYSPVAAAPAPAVAPAISAAPAAAVARVEPQVTPPPRPAAVDPSTQATPPPLAMTQRGHAHGAAVAATMMALPASPAAVPLGVPLQNRAPAAAPAGNNAHLQATPPPVAQARPEPAPAPRSAPAAAAPAPAAAAPGAAAAAQAGGQQGANFRETLWFKKGDVEQMVAEAKAKASAGRTETPSGSHEVPVEDAKPLEDRYVDDGSVTVEDRKKFSLRAGATAAGVPVVAGSIPGERMSDAEMINEIGGGKRTKVIGFAAVAVAAVIAVLVFTMHGKGKSEKPAPAPAEPAAAAAKATGEPPTGPPPAPTKTAEAPAAAPAEEPEPAHARRPRTSRRRRPPRRARPSASRPSTPPARRSTSPRRLGRDHVGDDRNRAIEPAPEIGERRLLLPGGHLDEQPVGRDLAAAHRRQRFGDQIRMARTAGEESQGRGGVQSREHGRRAPQERQRRARGHELERDARKLGAGAADEDAPLGAPASGTARRLGVGDRRPPCRGPGRQRQGHRARRRR